MFSSKGSTKKTDKDKKPENITFSPLPAGNKPDFHLAKSPDEARLFYEGFLGDLRRAYQADKVKDGQFGAMMAVSLVNDGPVTIELQSPTPAAAAAEKK